MTTDNAPRRSSNSRKIDICVLGVGVGGCPSVTKRLKIFVLDHHGYNRTRLENPILHILLSLIQICAVNKARRSGNLYIGYCWFGCRIVPECKLFFVLTRQSDLSAVP